ncbi:MAG: ferritin-like domain-containing protein, partial [Acidimicrobiales bacterium]
MAFDIDDFERTSTRVEIKDLELERAFEEQPLDADSLRCLQYMYDIESHTPCFLRDLLVTDAHRDPAVTTFLTLWNYEEHWHGESLGRVLAAHGRPAGKDRVSDVRGDMSFRDRLRPISFVLGSLVLPDMVAVHMAWGAINEWSTQTAYGLLSRRAAHPVLSELLSRIMRQEGRH